MTIGSDLYSDLYIAKLIQNVKRYSLCDAFSLLVVAILLVLVAVSNFLAINVFSASFDVNDAYSVIFLIIGIIYLIESVLLIINLCCRSVLIIVLCILMSGCNLGIAIYRMFDLKEYNNYYTIFPIIADIAIIPILGRLYCKTKRSMQMHQQFVLLQDDANNQIIVPKYNSNSILSSKNTLSNDVNYKQIQFNTAGLDVGEDGDSNLLSSVEVNDEDDEKADVLIMNTPGGDLGDVGENDDD